MGFQCEWEFVEHRYFWACHESPYRRCCKSGWKSSTHGEGSQYLCSAHRDMAVTELDQCVRCKKYMQKTGGWTGRLIKAVGRIGYDHCCLDCYGRFDLDEANWGKTCSFECCALCGRLGDPKKICTRYVAGETFHHDYFLNKKVCEKCWKPINKTLKVERQCRDIRRDVKSLKERISGKHKDSDDGRFAGIPGSTDARY